MSRCLLMLLAIATLAVPQALARDWYVNPDGSGDAPTIQAAFTASAAGDVIHLRPGTFYEHDIVAKAYVELRSVSGPEVTIIDSEGGGKGIVGYEYNAPLAVEGITIMNGDNEGISLEGGGSQVIRSCVVWNFSVGVYGRYFEGIVADVTSVGGRVRPSGSGFSLSHCSPTLVNCISAFNGGYGIVTWTADVPTLRCCCVYGNAGGDFEGMPDPTGQDGNISLDPLFCDLAGGDLHLAPASPCAPGENPSCGLIGALPVGCGSTPVGEATWGAVKAMFRQ